MSIYSLGELNFVTLNQRLYLLKILFFQSQSIHRPPIPAITQGRDPSDLISVVSETHGKFMDVFIWAQP